jgi:hypothetical protein
MEGKNTMIRKLIIISAVMVGLLSVSPMAVAVEFGSDSANITNKYFPFKVGAWGLDIGAGNWTGLLRYFHAVGTEIVSGAKIGTQTFNNVKCLKVNLIDTEEDDIITFWAAQDTQGNVWMLKLYSSSANTTYILGTYFKSMLMPAVPHVGDPADITIPETETDYCRCVAVNISLNTNFGSYDSCIKTHCFHESSTEVGYYCPEVGGVRSSHVESPGDVMDLKEYGIATDKRVVVIPLGD